MTDAALTAVGVAWLLGLGAAAIVWPRETPLSWLAWLAIGGLVGPCVAGAAAMLLGLLGLASAAPLIVTSMAVVLVGAGWRRTCRVPREFRLAGDRALLLAVVVAVATTGLVAQRTHLGWDGTVVWLHRARMLAASDGVMPQSAIADATRSWTAPDYPLHVPSAMAWVQRWQGREDERSLKSLPAAWSAAIICLVAAAIRDRAGTAMPAVLGVLVVASAPRLLVGEGSLTSGYADGPMAGLLAATWWLASRAGWGHDPRWTPLLALLAACLAWTKQEGAVAVAIVAAMCVWSTRRASALRFALPAAAVAGTWHAWVLVNGAPTTMAYGFAGVLEIAGRVPVVTREYLREISAWHTWGALWPALIALWLTEARRHDPRDVVVLGAVVAMGGVAFVFSAWPDLVAHLQVTVGRQLVQVVPAAVMLAFGGAHRRMDALESPA